MGLAEVYALDMGKRTVDKDMWIQELDEYPDGANVIEVGYGNGRLHRLVGDHAWSWFGMEIDNDFLGLDEGVGLAEYADDHMCMLGDATLQEDWEDLWRKWVLHLVCGGGLPEVVIIPYSTLYLIPHDQQVQVVRHALGVAPKVLVEVFVPQLTTSGVHVQLGACASPEGDDRMWARKSSFCVDADTRTTRVLRQYGPVGAWQVQVQETIYWRLPSELQSVVAAAGLKTDLRSGAPVPAGHVLLEVAK
jgi:hypothetical protein